MTSLLTSEKIGFSVENATLSSLSVDTTELYHSAKGRQHSFDMLEGLFCPTLVGV